MYRKQPHPHANGLIESLGAEQRRAFLSRAGYLNVAAGQVLVDVEQPISDVYFPTTAVLSVVNLTARDRGVQTSVVGYEGMTPIGAFHQIERSSERIVVQVAGQVLHMRRQEFHAALADAPEMRASLRRFAQSLFSMAAQTSACSRDHTVVQRCAHWLLMTHDRVPADEFRVTHALIAQMLGVRRSSITIAAESLRAAGAISYTRGRLRIESRTALEQEGCDCYSLIRNSGVQQSVFDGRTDRLGASHDASATPSVHRASKGHFNRVSPATHQRVTEYSNSLRDALRRVEVLRLAQNSRDDGQQQQTAVQLAEELDLAFQQLQVAEEELRVQMEALEDMRQAMETQHEHWRARFDGLPDAFIETDKDDIIIAMNRAAEALLGHSRGRFIGRPLVTLFPDTDRRGLREVITRLRAGAPAAHWSGTLLARLRARPDVHVAVAANSGVSAPYIEGRDIEGRAMQSRSLPGTYFGARWLLRVTPAREIQLS